MIDLKQHPVLRFLSSYGLSVIVLLLLGVLTFLGTWEQRTSGIYQVQQEYFESIFLVVHLPGGIPIPLPRAYLLMVVLFVNLLLGGILRAHWNWRVAGVIIAHLGILFLLLSSFVSLTNAVHGNVTLYVGEQTDEFRSHYLWEIALFPAPGTPDRKPVRESLIPHDEFAEMDFDESRLFRGAEIPFELTIRSVMENSRAVPEGARPPTNPVVDGIFLEWIKSEKETEQNLLGAYVDVLVKGAEAPTTMLLWAQNGRNPAPLFVDANGARWAVELRKKRSNLPFALRLDKFTHEYYPGTRMPRTYMSDVTKIEDGTERKVKIEMNQPLRQKGFTVYQSNWGPPGAGKGAKLYSGFSVVTNPSDQWPLIACIVIGIGLFVHFTRMLFLYLRRETGARS